MISSRNLSEIKQKLRNTKFHVEIVENHQKWFFLKAVKT